MSPIARGWFDALLGIALISALSSCCDPAPEVAKIKNRQEIFIMETAHTQGPCRAIHASPTGYTIIQDEAGRTIGAALSGNDGHTHGLPKEMVEANGRLFASASKLYAALAGYMAAVEEATNRGEFTVEILQRIDQAHEEALLAFEIIEQGRPS